MARTKKKKRTPTPEEKDDAFDMRTYSDLVVWNVQDGLERGTGFQYYSMKMPGRNQGILELLGNQIKNLTHEMRVTPVYVQFTPTGKKTKIYVFASVRSSKSGFYLH